MTAVTNHGEQPIGFPTGEHIARGETVEVAEWAEMVKKPVYAYLFEQGVLTVPEDAPSAPPLPKRK